MSQQNPDWFRRKYHTNLNLALDRENQLCIQLLADIEDGKMRPEYLLFEQAQCANGLYCFQACQHAVENLGSKNGNLMYHHEVDFRTQYDFNHTTLFPFIKQTHLYRLNLKNETNPNGYLPK